MELPLGSLDQIDIRASLPFDPCHRRLLKIISDLAPADFILCTIEPGENQVRKGIGTTIFDVQRRAPL